MCEESFQQLKSSLAKIPMLGYPDVNKPYVLYCDASQNAVGAALTQPGDDKDSIIPGVPNEKPL